MRQGWCISLRLPVHLRANNHSINSKKHLLFINSSQNQGLLIGNDNYTAEYKFKFSSTHLFIETYLDEFSIQKNLLSFYLNNQKIAYYDMMTSQ